MSIENGKNCQILIVDDESLIRKSLYEILRIEGYRVQMAASGEEAIDILPKNKIDIVITDLKLPRMNGIELLKEIKTNFSKTEVILITGYGSIETAVKAMRKGAYDYITKPINDNEIKIIINKIIEKQRILNENEELKEILAKEIRDSFCGIIGSSAKMQHVYHTVDSVATTHATILITGESGTGKGLVAKAIHDSDQNRKNHPFVEVNCGALSETLLESELFGHVKGAFTGAIKDKIGRFEYAQGGTIFLDEIDAFPPRLQVKLLRILQDRGFERVGDNDLKTADVRIIVAANQPLMDLVEKRQFREDLYYRINVIEIHMPPLRERKDDMEALTKYFIKKYSEMNNKNVTGVCNKVKKFFETYHWPGNVRELENAIAGAVIIGKSDTINEWDIPKLFKSSEQSSFKIDTKESLKKVVEQPEKEYIISILNDCHWNRNKAASILGVNRTTLYNKMKKYKITNP